MKIKYKVFILILLPLFLVSLYMTYEIFSSISEIRLIRYNQFYPHTEQLEHSANIRFIHSQMHELSSLTILYSEDKQKIRQLMLEHESLGIDMNKNFDLIFASYNRYLNVSDPAERIREEKEMEELTAIMELANEADRRRAVLLMDIHSNSASTRENIILFLPEYMEIERIDNEVFSRLSSFISQRSEELIRLDVLIFEKEEVIVQRFSLAIGSLIVMFVFVSLFLDRHISAPLEDITNVSNAISKGHLDIEVCHTERDDEIGSLASSFDRMLMSLKILMKRSR